MYTKTYTTYIRTYRNVYEVTFVVMEHVHKNLCLMLKLNQTFARCFLFLLEKVEENVYSCSVERKRNFQIFQSFTQNDFLQII